MRLKASLLLLFRFMLSQFGVILIHAFDLIDRFFKVRRYEEENSAAYWNSLAILEFMVTSDLKQALEDGWSDDEINSKLQPEGLLLKEKINECQRRSSASSSQSINKDPITQVFGPEHQGVRGLGFGVTPSNVCATTQSTILVRNLQADFRRLEEKDEQLTELIRSQQMPPSSWQQQNNPPNICGKKCMILDWLSPKKIVDEGKVETDDPMHLVDGIPIGGNAYLVYVEKDLLVAIVSDSDTEEERGEDASSNSKKKRWFSTIFQNIAGKANLEKSDLESALNALKDRLMVQNVAKEITVQLCESVSASLEGKKLASFTTVSSIVKVAYWLQQHNISVMMATCDTFRSGAVEQLKTHARRLQINLFEKGYEKDPAIVAKEAIQEATRSGKDVVLVDTAGRIQMKDDFGEGEVIIRGTLARNVAAMMKYKELQEAVDWVVKNRLDGQAGMIAVSSEREVAYGFNSNAMFRGCVTEDGFMEVGIWE
ncbi:hypothetical protein Sjap_002723 [Stephania japonica]|uniref:SRP54-type proteins GTP-binding domain-containing protein n=1 Tax=Stephania japonica TaxID=461633 RepID=A0AAP0PST6_9MAGN